MNKKLLTAILCVIWAIGVSGICLYYVNRTGAGIVYSWYSDSVSAGSRTYVTDNSVGTGVLYYLDSNGSVRDLYTAHFQKYISGWKAEYVRRDSMAEDEDGLYVLYAEDPETNSDMQRFRICAFDRRLNRIGVTKMFFVKSDAYISGFSVGQESFYVTELSTDRRDAFIFEIPLNECVDPAEKDKSEDLLAEAVELEESDEEKAPSGKYYAEAEYSEGMLFTRYDGQSADEYFSETIEAKSLFDNRTETLMQRLIVVGMSPFTILGIIIIGGVVIGLMVYSLSSRRRVVYRMAIFEAVVFGMMLCVVGFIVVRTDYDLRRQYVQYEEYVLGTISETIGTIVGTKDALDKTSYSEIMGEAGKTVNFRNYAIDTFDIILAERESGDITMSLRGFSGDNLEYVYGSDLAKFVSESSTAPVSTTVSIGGTHYIFVIDPVSGISGQSIAVVAKYKPVFVYIFESRKDLIVIFLVLFVGVSLLGLSVIYREGRDLRELGIALEQLAEGREDIRKPSHLTAWDMNRMWSIIQEIQRKLLTTRYSKYLIYEAYYRFAPKGVEKILGKESITEIASGDTAKLNGTICFISTGGQIADTGIQEKNTFLELLEEYREQENGVFVASDTDLSSMQLLFLDETKTTTRFGAEFFSEFRGKPKDRRFSRVTMLLHYTSFMYGVVGSKDHISTFLTSYEMDSLSQYADWFYKLRLGLIVTEDVRKREKHGYKMRYIGFIRLGPDNSSREIKLYEILDAERAENRRGKLNLLNEFEEGLELFYQKDFYLARNVFTEILRQNPWDDMARWYLFESEDCLNNPDEYSFEGAIHM